MILYTIGFIFIVIIIAIVKTNSKLDKEDKKYRSKNNTMIF